MLEQQWVKTGLCQIRAADYSILKFTTYMGNKQTSILPECQLLLVISELRMLAWLWILNGLCLPDFTPYFKTSARLDQPSSRGRL
jgi:hypothetical protein